MKSSKKALLLAIGLLFSAFFAFAQNQERADSIRTQINSLPKVDSNYIELVYELCKIYGLNQFDSVIKYSTYGHELASAMGHKTLKIKLALFHAYALNAKGSYNQAFDVLEEVFNSGIDSSSKEFVEALRMKGDFLQNTSSIDKVTKYYELGLKYADAHPNLHINLLNSLACLYLDLYQYDKCIAELKKCFLVSINEDNQEILLNPYINLGVAYYYNFENDSAIKYYAMAESIAAKTENLISQIIILENLASLYAEQGNFVASFSNHRKAQKIIKKIGSPSHLANNYLFFGEAFKLAGSLDSAIFYLESAKKMLLNQGDKRHLSMCFEDLSEVYFSIGDYKKAFEYSKSHIQLNDSLLKEAYQKSLLEMNTKYETEKKEALIHDLEQENELKELELSQHRLIIIFSLFGLGILIGISFLGFRFMQLRQRQNLAKTKIEEQKKGIAAAFEATENERKRFSKELHDGVGQLLSAVSHRLEGLEVEKHQIEKKQLAKTILDEACQEIRQISHEIMPKTLTEFGLFTALENLSSKTFDSHIKSDFESNLPEKKRFSENIELSVFRISQEILNNILKHAKAKNISVQCNQLGKFLILHIEDDGEGFDLTKASSGIGISNIKARAGSISAEFNIESQLGKGTSVFLRIPIND